MIDRATLHFLGTGTSSGIPAIGCDCAVCVSDDPRDRRLRTAGALRFVDPAGLPRTILIDCGPDMREQALRARLDRCDGILFTHSHVDHVFGLDEVRRFNAVMRAPIDIFADRSTMEDLQRVYRHIFERARNPNDSFVATLVPRIIEPFAPFELHGLQVLPLALLHGNQPVLGFRIDAVDRARRIAAEQPAPLPLAWCTDVSAIPPGTWRHLGGLRTLVLDMLRIRRHPTHLTLDEAIAVAGRIGAEETWFVHMSHDVRHAEIDGDLPAGVRLAHDGLVLPATADPYTRP
ncbi:MAG TPA: MBL fold metallo-hydrolase [Phycisphaerales bacterium]|nr:MBL fold metallo-hydrolase [Phycisphaerales bacterium]HMP36763.1 MBL fold metallo-hydrolase [Phycisphaerales bacterium]